MTQQELQNWLTQWYGATDDYVLLFSQDWNMLWKNRDCPMLGHETDYPTFFHLSSNCPTRSERFTICYAGELYMAELDVHTDADQQPIYLVRISADSCQKVEWESAAWRGETENQAATFRSKAFAISNAVSSLYSMLDEYGSYFSHAILDEMMDELNNIQNNCCKLAQPSLCFSELSNYHQNQDISGEVLFLDRELSNFAESCRNVLGKTFHIRVHAEPFLRIYTNRDRFEMCLLYLVVHIQKTNPKITDLYLEASARGDDVLISFTSHCSRMDFEPEDNKQEQLYQTDLITPEEQVIRLFCRTYHATLFTSVSDKNDIHYTLRFPASNKDAAFTLHSPARDLYADSFSIYQIVLSEFSSYRFY